METDIIVDGFRKCEEQHGLRYIEFIGDGDSSVYPSLISNIPWGYAIKKLECTNHSKMLSFCSRELGAQQPYIQRER